MFFTTVGTPAANTAALTVGLIGMALGCMLGMLKGTIKAGVAAAVVAASLVAAVTAAWASGVMEKHEKAIQSDLSYTAMQGRWASYADQLFFVVIASVFAAIVLLSLALTLATRGEGYQQAIAWPIAAIAFVLIDAALCNGEWAYDFRDWAMGYNSVTMASLYWHWLLWLLPVALGVVGVVAFGRAHRYQRTLKTYQAEAAHAATVRSSVDRNL